MMKQKNGLTTHKIARAKNLSSWATVGPAMYKLNTSKNLKLLMIKNKY